MKLFCRIGDADELYSPDEVTIQSTAEELRTLANFLIACACGIELDKNWEHEHFSDFMQFEGDNPDLVVVGIHLPE